MIHCQGRPRRRVRSVFLSDTHLGCHYSQAEALLAFLERHEPEYLYLVGDIVDGWRLRKSWHWTPVYNKILKRLFELGNHGTIVRYTPGNHDNFLRHFLADFGFVHVADQFLHTTTDGDRYLVLHGDQFDNVEIRAQWLSVVGSVAYDSLMWLSNRVDRARRLVGLEPCYLSSSVKRRVKQAVKFVSSFEERLAAAAREHDCQGVICGHVHTPTATRWHGVNYFNTGDWVENRSALMEYTDGSLEVLHLAADPQASTPVKLAPPRETAVSQELRRLSEQLVISQPRLPVAV